MRNRPSFSDLVFPMKANRGVFLDAGLLRHARALIESGIYFDRMPDPSLVAPPNATGPFDGSAAPTHPLDPAVPGSECESPAVYTSRCRECASRLA